MCESDVFAYHLVSWNDVDTSWHCSGNATCRYCTKSVNRDGLDALTRLQCQRWAGGSVQDESGKGNGEGKGSHLLHGKYSSDWFNDELTFGVMLDEMEVQWNNWRIGAIC